MTTIRLSLMHSLSVYLYIYTLKSCKNPNVIIILHMEKNFKSHTHTEELETLNPQKITCVLLLMTYVWLWRINRQWI